MGTNRYHRYFKLLLWCCHRGCCSKDKQQMFAIRSDKLAFSFVLFPFGSIQLFPGIMYNKLSVLWFIPDTSVFYCVLLKIIQWAFQKYIVKIANLGTGVYCAGNYLFFYPESLLTTVLIFNFKFKNVWVKKNNFIDEYFISITTLWLQITLKFWTFSIIHDLKATTFWTTVKILHSMGIEKWENLLRRAEYKFRAPPA